MFADRLFSKLRRCARRLCPRTALLALILVSGSSLATSIPNRPVASLDLQRYMGEWHEIAHLPLYFQRKCIGPITANSIMGAESDIKLRATCPTGNSIKTVDLLVTPKQNQTAAFGIRFAWLSWLHHDWFDYWVIDIDPHYQWAVVGSPDAKHLWILGRERGMSLALYQRLVARAREQGYAVEKLVIVAPLKPR